MLASRSRSQSVRIAESHPLGAGPKPGPCRPYHGADPAPSRSPGFLNEQLVISARDASTSLYFCVFRSCASRRPCGVLLASCSGMQCPKCTQCAHSTGNIGAPVHAWRALTGVGGTARLDAKNSGLCCCLFSFFGGGGLYTARASVQPPPPPPPLCGPWAVGPRARARLGIISYSM
jgi:hypothetical protein